jgi:UTP-glucose-1-phosphate uridylyltransferase
MHFSFLFYHHYQVAYAFQPVGDLCPEGVVRTKPWGTVHAVFSAKEVIGKEPFLVQNADDYYGKTVYEQMYTFLVSTERKVASKHCLSFFSFLVF